MTCLATTIPLGHSQILQGLQWRIWWRHHSLFGAGIVDRWLTWTTNHQSSLLEKVLFQCLEISCHVCQSSLLLRHLKSPETRGWHTNHWVLYKQIQTLLIGSGHPARTQLELMRMRWIWNSQRLFKNLKDLEKIWISKARQLLVITP